jgi:hypothetical protein
VVGAQLIADDEQHVGPRGACRRVSDLVVHSAISAVTGKSRSSTSAASMTGHRAATC